ncbi:DUF551 domain-containing protein [Klebsiella pneumoniae]|uniref:DUF551 domain-containing protein n=1 Tax=Klebsiella pneumoniae TaxID=573 RepID=UPI00300E525D
MTSKFSIDNRELLQRISSGEAVVGIDFGNLIVRELAAFRLAAMDSEPVFTLEVSQADYKGQKLGNHFGFITLDAARKLKEGNYQLYRHAQPAPVVPNGLRLALSNAGIAAPESDEMLAATCEKHIQALVTWVKDRKPFQSAPVVPSFEEWLSAANRKLLGWVKDAMREASDACRAAMLQELKKSAGTEAICRSDENVHVLHTKSPAQSDCCPAQNSVTPVQNKGWIPVSERMPEDEQEVLTINKMGHRFVSFFDKHSGLFFDRLDAPAACCIERVLVTHWMPLPTAPQEPKP